MVTFLNIEDKVTLYNVPYEDLDLESVEKVDIVLTSPPYFDIEIYASNSNQSYQKYSEYNSWMDNWYIPMITRNLSILKKDGLSCYNVMNGRCENIVERTIQLHEDMGFDLVDHLGIDSPFKNYKKKLNRFDLTYVFKNTTSHAYYSYDATTTMAHSDLFVFE
jgi:DNA modification methylase